MFDGLRSLDPAGVPDLWLWAAPLDRDPAEVESLAGVLSAPELRRLEALRSGAARRRFIVRRAALRALVGETLGMAPEAVQFVVGDDGKPGVPERGGRTPCHFNTSSAREVAVFAISRLDPVGIDVEWTEGTTPLDRVAERFFSTSEREALAAAPPERRRAQFFRTWVRKEAFLKGLGDGISARIRATRLGGGAARDGTAGVEDGWVVRDLGGLPAGYLASVAIEARHPGGQAAPQAGRTAGHSGQPRH